jgi:hypothetical protein
MLFYFLALAGSPDILAGIMTEKHSEPLSLEEVNELLEQQEGRCIWCGALFEHCGGTLAHEIMIPCTSCWQKMDGLICETCASKSNHCG